VNFGLVELTDAQRAFADEVARYLDQVVTAEAVTRDHETGDGFIPEVHLALGARGWVMPDWPLEHGGAGLDPVSCRILEWELRERGVPYITMLTTRMVWTAVARFGQPDLVERIRPGVAAGTVRFCLGYTEPEGGSDLAAARLRAVRDGDEWLLNGAKMFTTGAQNSQYTFLITLTDPDAPKRRGLTMFLVPLDLDGVEIQAVRTFGGERTNLVYYGDVRVPDPYRLGGVNDGWAVLRGPMEEEHQLGAHGALDDFSVGRNFLRTLEPALAAAVEWAATPGPDGRRPADDPAVLARLGRIAAELEAGICTPGAMGRVKASDVVIDCSADLVDLLGPLGLLRHGAPGAPGGGAIEFAHRFAQGTSTYGGTVEVFRNILAQQALGLPRPAYLAPRSAAR
jgi:alkylation response protein AidB-like acyl-CoA dehydrogenase